jgi:hypothetical protein
MPALPPFVSGQPDTKPVRLMTPTMTPLTYVEMALVRADRLTATERAMASTVRGRPGRTHGGFS